MSIKPVVVILTHCPSGESRGLLLPANSCRSLSFGRSNRPPLCTTNVFGFVRVFLKAKGWDSSYSWVRFRFRFRLRNGQV